MENQLFSNEQVQMILRAQETVTKARIFDSSANHPFMVQAMTIDLTTAKLSTAPLKIGFPFRTIFVQDATDASVSLNIRLGGLDAFQSRIALKKNDSFAMPFPVSEAYIDWTAQASKSATLVFFVDGEFRPGSQISVVSGGITVSEGGSTAAIASVALVALTAAAIAPASATRIMTIIQNKTGADLFIGGDATITDDGTIATAGIKIAADGLIEWKNTGALYGYSVGGGRVNRFECTT